MTNLKSTIIKNLGLIACVKKLLPIWLGLNLLFANSKELINVTNVFL